MLRGNEDSMRDLREGWDRHPLRLTSSLSGCRRLATLLHTPLYERQRDLGAKFAPFSGWSMPLEYAGAGVLAEHAAVRNAVGIFDVSHLGKIAVSGAGAAAFVNRCLTADLNKIGAGQAQYTLICNDSGGVVDDLIAYRPLRRGNLPDPQRGERGDRGADVAGGRSGRGRGLDQHDEHVVLAVQGVCRTRC